jgi:nucleoside phosphorylase
VILTAIPDEFDAIRAHMTDRQKDTHPQGTIYTLGRFEGGEGWDVALTQTGAGNFKAAAEATRACDYFPSVDVLLFVGVAGGIKDVAIGDVVAADRIYGYDGGKDSKDGFLPRTQTGCASYRLEHCARDVVTDGVWVDRIVEKRTTAPKAYVKPIASGEKVIASLDTATAQYIKQSFSDAVAVEMEGVGVLEAARQAQVQAIIIRGISDLADNKHESDRAGMQREASQNAAAFAFEMLANLSMGDGNGDTKSPPPGPWKLPPGVEDYLDELRKRDATASDNLRDFLTNNAASAGLIRDLVRNPPRWMTSTNAAYGWAAVTVYAMAHGNPDIAADAAMRAVAEGIPHSSRWLAWAGVARLQTGQPDDVATLRAQLEESADDDFVAAVIAALDNDAKKIVSLANRRNNLTDSERIMLDTHLINALAMVGRDEEALALSERLMIDFPDRAGPRTARAQILASRAASGRAADRGRDFARARGLALEARDLIRSWGGNSSPPVVLAAQIALDEGEAPLALQLTRPAPLGEATNQESLTSGVLEVAGNAAMASGNTAVLEQILSDTESKYGRAILEAEIAARAEQPTSVICEKFRSAYENAETRNERYYCLYRIAGAGEWPIAGLEEFEGPEAEEITARSELARGDFDAAIRRLRPLSRSRLICARDLARTYVAKDDSASALQTLTDAAERFSDPFILMEALDVAVDARRPDDIEAIGTKLLAALPTSSFARRRTHWRLVELYSKNADWVRMETHARALLANGETSPLARWALVISLFNENRRVDAWRALAEHPALEPLDEFQGRIKIELTAENDGSSDGIQAILDLAERFGESEEFVAAALMAVYHIQPPPELSGALLQRLQDNMKQFFERFPESTILSKIEFNNPEEMVQKLTDVMQRKPDIDLAPVREVAAGRLPFGLISVMVRRTYAETLADRSSVWLVANGINEHLESVERDAVNAALDESIVLDPSALMILSLHQELWRTIVATFKQIVITDIAAFDIARANAASKLNTAGYLTLTPDGRLSMVEVREEDRRAVTQRLQWMTETAEGLRQEPVRKLELFPSADVTLHGPWLGSISASKNKGWPLYIDDVALRMAAADASIPAFGTLGLLKVLVEQGTVSAESMTEMRREMAINLVGDIPGVAELIPDIGRKIGWNDQKLIATAARQSVWSDRSEAIKMFVQLLHEIGRDQPEALHLWLFSAIKSGQPILGEPGAKQYRSSLLLNAISGVLNPRDHAKNLVTAARAAADIVGGDDPLQLAIEQLHTAALQKMSPGDAARYVIEIFGGLEPPDRQIVMRMLLAAS